MSANSNPLTNGSYWGPVGEASSDILLERTFMASAYLMGLGFGVQFAVYFAAMLALGRGKRTGTSLGLMAYTTLMCISNFLLTITTFIGLEESYIDNRNFPGGVLGYIGASTVLSFNVVSVTSLVIGNVLADFLLIWRCGVIWRASGTVGALYTMAVLFVPTCLALASLATGLTWDVESASPDGFFTVNVENIALIYFSLTFALNILVTGLISFRIKYYESKLKISNPHSTSTFAMFIESAALYTIVFIPVLVTFARNSPLNQIFIGIAPATQLGCAYWIVWRIGDGRAWSRVMFTESNGTLNGGHMSSVDEEIKEKSSQASI